MGLLDWLRSLRALKPPQRGETEPARVADEASATEGQAPQSDGWWLRGGAPKVHLTLATNRSTRTIAGSVLSFTRDIRGLEVRSAGFDGGDTNWRVMGRGDVTSSGVAFHLGRYVLPAEDDEVVEIEARFWWGNDERHVVFRSTAGAVIASNTLGTPQYP